MVDATIIYTEDQISLHQMGKPTPGQRRDLRILQQLQKKLIKNKINQN